MGHKTKKNKWEQLSNIYKDFKRYLSFIILFFLLAIRFIPLNLFKENLNAITYLASIAFGFALLDILFDLRKEVTSQPKSHLRFLNFNSLYKESRLIPYIEAQLYDDKKVEIKVIGISLRKSYEIVTGIIRDYSTGNINTQTKDNRQYSSKRKHKYHFDITFMMLNPECYDAIPNINKTFKGKFRPKNDIEESLEAFNQEVSTSSSRATCTIELLKYNYLPNIYGFLIDDTYLYMGNTYWGEDDNFRGAGGIYDFYQEDDDFGGTDKIDIFNSWIEHNRQNQEPIKYSNITK